MQPCGELWAAGKPWWEGGSRRRHKRISNVQHTHMRPRMTAWIRMASLVWYSNRRFRTIRRPSMPRNVLAMIVAWWCSFTPSGPHTWSLACAIMHTHAHRRHVIEWRECPAHRGQSVACTHHDTSPEGLDHGGGVPHLEHTRRQGRGGLRLGEGRAAHLACDGVNMDGRQAVHTGIEPVAMQQPHTHSTIAR